MGLVDRARGLGLGMIIWVLAVPIFLFTSTHPTRPKVHFNKTLPDNPPQSSPSYLVSPTACAAST